MSNMCFTKQKIAKLNIRLTYNLKTQSHNLICMLLLRLFLKKLFPRIMSSMYKNKRGIKFHYAQIGLNKTLFGCQFLNT